MTTITQERVDRLKEAGQDFEWYPTTTEIMDAVAYSIKDAMGDNIALSVLDVGAGDGRVLHGIEERYGQKIVKYAIEKAKVHLDSYAADIFIAGTDFYSQSFMRKAVAVIFCNPPYSEYEQWMSRLVVECSAQHLYLVVPARWEQSEVIQHSLSQRKGVKVEWLLTTDFLSADRKARAKVDVLHLDYTSEEIPSAFSTFFDEMTHGFVDRFAAIDAEIAENKKEQDLTARSWDEVVALESSYVDACHDLYQAYQKVSEVDPVILKTLGLQVDGIKGGLKAQLDSLRSKYWGYAIDGLDAVAQRFNYKARRTMTTLIEKASDIDFSATNVYAVILWCLKNYDEFLDTQIVELYDRFASPKGMKAYKSNKHWKYDTWRANKPDTYRTDDWYFKQDFRDGTVSRLAYKLDYRFVYEMYNLLDTQFNGHTIESGQYEGETGYSVNYKADEIFGDFRNVAESLGIKVDVLEFERRAQRTQLVKPGAEYSWAGKLNGQDIEFCRLRLYKKGTIHFKFCKEFVERLNVAYGRINKWLRTPEAAEEELGVTNAAEIFGITKQCLMLEVAEVYGGGLLEYDPEGAE